MHERVLAEMSF